MEPCLKGGLVLGLALVTAGGHAVDVLDVLQGVLDVSGNLIVHLQQALGDFCRFSFYVLLLYSTLLQLPPL